MAMAGRVRSALPMLNKILRSETVSGSGHRSSIQRSILPSLTKSEFSRNYSTAPTKKDDNIKVPVKLFGGAGNYASALFLAAKKANVLDKVESDIADLVEASKRSTTFSNFMKDLSVPNDTRTKAIEDICGQAKFADITKNFLVVLAVNGRLKNLETIAKKFSQLTMADKGEVKAIVTSVIPIPPEEEKELKETLQDVLGLGKKVHLEQKIDESILGGLVIEFEQKVFDMSIRTRALQMERYLREPANIGNL